MTARRRSRAKAGEGDFGWRDGGAAGTVPCVQLSPRSLAVFCAALGLTGCTDSPPAAPTLQLPFASSAASPVLFNGVEGVQVGTTGHFAFGLLNAGTEDLVIQDAGYTGDPAMALGSLVQPLPSTLAFNGEFVIPLTCTPTAENSYDGSVSILSNAVNGQLTVVYLSCVGV